ncbi:MAG: hypothetical protein HN390_14740 [Anaerolineae bacterium]|nr:hypothetical protein [Anaerolineae bacterium]
MAAPVPVLARVVPVLVLVVDDNPKLGHFGVQRLQTLGIHYPEIWRFLTPLKGSTKMLKNGVYREAKNNPPHLFVDDSLYMFTASTYKQQPYLRTDERKLDWINAFLKASEIYQWEVLAWVVLDNHYHTMLRSPKNTLNMDKFIGSYHKFTARKWNREDQLLGRKIWWNYWDTCIRSENDYWARLSYIFSNPVKHGLVDEPEDYLFSNYKDFLSAETWAGLASDGDINDIPEF